MKTCKTCDKPVDSWPTIFKGDRTCSVLCEKALEAQEHPHKDFSSASATAVPDLPPAPAPAVLTVTNCGAPENHDEHVVVPPPEAPWESFRCNGDGAAFTEIFGALSCPGCHEPLPPGIRVGEKTTEIVMYRHKVWHRACAEGNGGHD